LADQYEEVTRFIRRTYRVLKQLEKSFGEEYDFTEEFIFMNIEATIEGFENFSIEEAEIFDKITVNSSFLVFLLSILIVLNSLSDSRGISSKGFIQELWECFELTIKRCFPLYLP